jgi:hypothetical protein
MAVGNYQKPQPTLWLAVASTGTTALSAKLTLPLADAYTFYINTTTATAGNLDVSFQTSVDGGTTYINLPWRFAQITTVSTNVLTVRLGLGVGEVGAETATADTGGTLALPAVPDVNFMKVKYTIGTGPFVFNLYYIALPKGSVGGL